MFKREDLEELLFIDIETVCKYKTYEEFIDKEPKLAELFDKRMDTFLKDDEKNLSKEDRFFKKSSLFPEFSKILCISIGIIRYNNEKGGYEKHISNFINNDEKIVLNEFLTSFNKANKKIKLLKFCGHNIDSFDLPFLIKRMLINNIKLPSKLILHNFKPWEFPTIDTMKIWKFGSYEWTSLDLLCNVMDIPSPKTEDVNNKIISELYYNGDKESMKKIGNYCNDDVDAVMNLMIKFSNL